MIVSVRSIALEIVAFGWVANKSATLALAAAVSPFNA
jgi:hypothetical protein